MGSRGRAERPSFYPSRAIQMLPIMQSDTVPSEDCSGGDRSILYCGATPGFTSPLSHIQLSLPPDPWVYQTFFHACRAHRQNLMVDKSELHSAVTHIDISYLTPFSNDPILVCDRPDYEISLGCYSTICGHNDFSSSKSHRLFVRCKMPPIFIY